MTKRPIKLTPIGGVLMCIGFSAGAIFGFAGSMLSIERTAVGIRADLAASRIPRANPAADKALADLLEGQALDRVRIGKLERLVKQLR